MSVLLDTTVQIDRMFKPEKREKINQFIRKNDCYCSSYVLGEFKANIVRNYVTLYGIMQIEDNLTDVYQKIAEVFSSRDKSRLIYLLNDLARDYNQDYQLIKEELEDYAERLERRFYFGINKSLINETKCARANAVVVKNGDCKLLKGIQCRKTDQQCAIEQFWKQRKHLVEGMEKEDIPEKMVPLLSELCAENKIPKGNGCRSMGDCVIALESLDLEEGKVLSTNKKDFEPICRYIGATLAEI